MPRKIEVLPESISQVIAAGEVVERPASVVKELMENAIDAGATEIVVELKAGGLQRIRVVDNGEGMDREDVPVALRRYATSKIKKAEDLYAIHTLGFRGEALPSIAQVSKMTLLTRPPHSLSGTKAVCEGGGKISISEIGCPIGTEIDVKDIFYNIPVKRKFLKSIRSELRHALHHFLRLSLSNPSISFKLIHDGRLLQEHLKSESPWVRMEAILGKEDYHHLHPIGFEEGEIQISGFASLPPFSKKNADAIYFYVNQRFVKDRMIYRAILDAYRHILPSNQFPMIVLFLNLPPSTVDVNVHPTKGEVKFRDPERIYRAVLAALRMEKKDTPFGLDPWRKESKTNELPLQDGIRPSPLGPERGFLPSFFIREKEEGGGKVEEGEGQWNSDKMWPYSVLGQITGTYILCEGEGNLIFIDQHAAHERVLFEKFKKEYNDHSMISEKLLLPILMECSAEESYILESSEEALKAIGFEIEPVGEKLFAIRSIPALIDLRDPQEMVREVLGELSFLEREGKGEEAVHTLLVALACHSAIRGNFMLKKEEMDQLLNSLTPFHPTMTCPHGRPIFFILPFEDLKKQFKRK